jgi:hypothetical protein
LLPNHRLDRAVVQNGGRQTARKLFFLLSGCQRLCLKPILRLVLLDLVKFIVPRATRAKSFGQVVYRRALIRMGIRREADFAVTAFKWEDFVWVSGVFDVKGFAATDGALGVCHKHLF